MQDFLSTIIRILEGAFMRLVEFQVQNYRSIKDSGIICVSDLTALIGRNESGKTNILRALSLLNITSESDEIDLHKNFPRFSKPRNCEDTTIIVKSWWELNDYEKGEIANFFPHAKRTSRITISLQYNAVRTVEFHKLKHINIDMKYLKEHIREVWNSLIDFANGLESGVNDTLDKFVSSLDSMIKSSKNIVEWAEEAGPAIQELDDYIKNAGIELSNDADARIEFINSSIYDVLDDCEAYERAVSWVLENMPNFIFLDDYPQLTGKKNIREYISRSTHSERSVDDLTFEKMCDVAELDLQMLQELQQSQNVDARNELTNNASEKVSNEIQRLWKDRKLRIRFNVDGDYISTYISDVSSQEKNKREIEIELTERSRGFQWFFSFYIMLAADTKKGTGKSAILLFDEPGIYLHGRAQKDLLRHFEEDFSNQIIYSTHSPFSIPIHDINSIRTVDFSEVTGTTVSNEPMLNSDPNALFPLQAAIGYDVAQSLFLSQNNLIVEGIIDFYLLNCMSVHLYKSNMTGLRDDITIIPVYGAQKMPLMAKFLKHQNLNFSVLLDQEVKSRETKKELVKNKIVGEKNIIFVSDGFEKPIPKDADMEDLLGSDLYLRLVKETHSRDWKTVQPHIENDIPRVAKRVDAAFKQAGLTFNKVRPAKLLQEDLAANTRELVAPDIVERFRKLLEIINSTFIK